MPVSCFARRSDVEALGILGVAELEQLLVNGRRARDWVRLPPRNSHLCTALERLQRRQQRTVIFNRDGRRCTYAQAHVKREAQIPGYFRRFRHRPPPPTSRRWLPDISKVEGQVPTPADKIRCATIGSKWVLVRSADPWGALLSPIIPVGQEMSTVKNARITGIRVVGGTPCLAVWVNGTRDSPYFD